MKKKEWEEGGCLFFEKGVRGLRTVVLKLHELSLGAKNETKESFSVFDRWTRRSICSLVAISR